MKPVLILGAQGLVGTALSKIFPEALLWDKHNLDLTNFPLLHSQFSLLNNQISAIINCVAYNDVDGAESNVDLAYLLNRDVPKHLALLANACRVPLVHFSTGYVFNGESALYTESDIPEPISVYGQSKYAGEKMVSEQGGRFYILRTNCVFGYPGVSALTKKSFVQIVEELIQARKTAQFISDELNSFTFASDLAEQVKYILDNKLDYGTYHVVNAGSASWYEFALEILKFLPSASVNFTTTSRESFSRPAKRPRQAILANTKLPPLRSWQSALRAFLLETHKPVSNNGSA